MRKTGRGSILIGILASMFTAGVVHASGDQALVFRAVGFYQGEADISEGSITCEIPNVQNAFVDNGYSMGLWNSFGTPTLSFPDQNNPFGDPCGGWIQLRNNMTLNGINLERVEIKMRIPGAGRFSNLVPTRKGFPLACKQFSKVKFFTGARLDPIDSEITGSNSGAPNVAFVQMIPMVSPQLIQCLRSQYTPLPTDVLSSVPLVISAKAVGRADDGSTYRTNTIRYTLTLRHVCGNGRLDDGEECDPNAPNTCFLGLCQDGECGDSGFPCFSDADCIGTCSEAGDPFECNCVF